MKRVIICLSLLFSPFICNSEQSISKSLTVQSVKYENGSLNVAYNLKITVGDEVFWKSGNLQIELSELMQTDISSAISDGVATAFPDAVIE